MPEGQAGDSSGRSADGDDTIDPGLLPFVELARQDLAGRLGIDIGSIVTLSAVVRSWPDSALGCPRPGMRYLQRPVDGSLIRLQVAGTVYRFHSGGARPPFLCAG